MNLTAHATPHAEALAALGLIRSSSEGPCLDVAALYALVDQLRAMGLPPDPMATQPAAHAPTHWLNGPKLILVNGLEEGRLFALKGGAAWLLGRDPEAEVRLASDPFVSRRHAELWRDGQTYFVGGLSHARNGIHVNWVPLPGKDMASLHDGDIVGLGRSLLVFRSA
jgi:hypothetical protein